MNYKGKWRVKVGGAACGAVFHFSPQAFAALSKKISLLLVAWPLVNDSLALIGKLSCD